MYALPSSRKLGLLSTEGTYYEMDSTLRIVPVTGSLNQQLLKEKISIPMPLIRIDGTSFLVTDNRGRRWRLPVTDTVQSVRMMQRQTRVVREVVTERDLLHCGGTFFELPADNADGFAKVKPIASHSFAIHDIASYRGMLLMSGADPLSKTSNAHLLRSSDGRIALWAGVIDDLWKFGRPVGKGGPWTKTQVQSGDTSDAYLFGGYDRRNLEIVNHGITSLTIRMQVDATGDGVWFDGQSFKINAGQRLQHLFPADLRGKWIRFRAESGGRVSTMLTYE